MNHLNRTISLCLLCFALLMASCSKQESIDDQFDQKLVLDATLEVGKPISGIFAHKLLNSAGKEVVSGLDIRISNAEQTVILTEDIGNKGYYSGPEDFIIEAKVNYFLNTSFKDQAISAQSSTPPSMEALETSKEFIDVDVQGDLVFLTWSGVNTGSFNEYFYVIELIPTEEDAEMIMRFSGNEQTSTVLSYTNEATLSANDFNFYGNHVIKVYAISKEYEDLFQPHNIVADNAPTNISGAYGYFIASSSIATNLEIR